MKKPVNNLADFKAAQAGDEYARTKLIEENMGLVYKYARKYYGYIHMFPHLLSISFDDLLSEGTRGLIKAIDKYNPSKGSFSNYAIRWIRSFILRFLEREHKYALKFLQVNIESLDEDDNHLTIEDVLARALHSESQINYEELKQKIEEANIPERSKKILKLYLIDGLSLAGVGRIVGLSKERVRQLIRKDGPIVWEDLKAMEE